MTTRHSREEPAADAAGGGQQGSDSAPLPGPPAVPKLLLTIPEAAISLGVSRAHMYRLIGEGGIRPVHSRGAVRIAVSELTRYVERLLQDTPNADEADMRSPARAPRRRR